jgi:sugar phosphate isomerase/epimerase
MAVVSFPHLSMRDATPPQIVKAAAEAGFDAVGLRLIPTMEGEAPHPMSLGGPMLREASLRLNDTGLRVLDIEAVWIRPDFQPKSVESAFEVAGELGARHVQVVGVDADETRTVEKFGELCELGASFGLTMDLEFMAFVQTNSLSKVLRIIEKSGAPNAAVLVDALHVNRCNVTIAELASIGSGRVNVFQICDGPARGPTTHEAMIHEARFARELPGLGAFGLSEILDALPADVAISVEVPMSQTIALSHGHRAGIIMKGYNDFCRTIGRDQNVVGR